MHLQNNQVLRIHLAGHIGLSRALCPHIYSVPRAYMGGFIICWLGEWSWKFPTLPLHFLPFEEKEIPYSYPSPWPHSAMWCTAVKTTVSAQWREGKFHPENTKFFCQFMTLSQNFNWHYLQKMAFCYTNVPQSSKLQTSMHCTVGTGRQTVGLCYLHQKRGILTKFSKGKNILALGKGQALT